MSELNTFRRTEVTPRAYGAWRYRCPVTQSFVLLTDERTLSTLARPLARLRCVACGEVHLLSQDGTPHDSASEVQHHCGA